MEDETLIALNPVAHVSARPSLVRTMVRPSVVVAAIYLLFLLFIGLSRGYQALDFVHLGTVWSLHDKAGSRGYDGQFYYQLARDPLHAYRFMDNAPYRYQRILYPLLVALLSLTNSVLIPYMLLLVNLASIIGSVEIIAALLYKRNISTWYSLAVGLYYGQAASLVFDTAEVFTCLLVCVGIWLLLADRVRLAALLLGLACLAREETILFPLAYVVQYSLQGRARAAILMTIYGCAPILLWLVVLALLFGQSGVTFSPPFEHIPFRGLFYYMRTPHKSWLLLLLMFVPTLGSTLLCTWELLCRRMGQGLIAWILNLLPVIFLSRWCYLDLISCGRVVIPLVLAMVLYGVVTRNRLILWYSQIYTLTFLIFLCGVALHMSSFLL